MWWELSDARLSKASTQTSNSSSDGSIRTTLHTNVSEYGSTRMGSVLI